MHTSTAAMASCSSLCVCLFFVVSSSLGDEDLCTNQWDLKVDGVPDSELIIHHSSTFLPGLFTHLVWHWRQHGKPSGTLWLSQAQKRGKFSGGFMGQMKSGFKLPASIQWSLYNGSLSVSSHGHQQELNRYPAWRVTVCNDLLSWGITEDKELYVTYDEVNETRSLDESWSTVRRFKRQAEFPVVPEEPGQKRNGTFSSWWRRFIDSIGGSYQGDKPRSWILDLTELILKLIFSTARVQGGSSNYPRNTDVEEIPRTYRDVESVTRNYPTLDIPKRIN